MIPHQASPRQPFALCGLPPYDLAPRALDTPDLLATRQVEQKEYTVTSVLALAAASYLAFGIDAHAQDSPFGRAVSLTSVVFFEVDHCPGVVVNGPIFHAGLVESGADLAHDNGAIQTMARINSKSMHEEGDAAHCAEFWAQLGPEGTDVIGLLSRAP